MLSIKSSKIYTLWLNFEINDHVLKIVQILVLNEGSK